MPWTSLIPIRGLYVAPGNRAARRVVSCSSAALRPQTCSLMLGLWKLLSILHVLTLNNSTY